MPDKPRCPLCGALTNNSYCYAHSWAAGEPATQPVAPAKLELVAGASTGSGRRLTARKQAHA